MNHNKLNIELLFDSILVHILKFSYTKIETPYPKHSHSDNSYEIHYIPSGTGELIANDTSYPLVPNTLYITGPHVEHEQIPNPLDPMYEYGIYLKINLPEGNHQQNLTNMAPILSTFLNTHFWIGADTEGIHSILQTIQLEFERNLKGHTIVIESLLARLLVSIIRNYEGHHLCTKQFPDSKPYDQEYLLIEDSFLYEYKSLTLQELASRLGLGTRQTSRILSSHYGSSFIEMRTRARMAAAVSMLRSNTYTLADIAENVGYSCSSHFCTAFQNYYKMSASTYRNQYINRKTLTP